MNPAKCNEYDYIPFLISTPRVYTCTEAARVQPEQPNPPAHDALTRLLYRLDATPAHLWVEAQPLVQRHGGILVLDDSTLEKPYAQQIALSSRHWSGKQHAVVQGINLITLLWTDGDSHIPCAYRIYHTVQDQLTKNDHFLALLQAAHERGFSPQCVVLDSWYSSRTNLKAVRNYGWTWLTQLKANRLVSQAPQPKVPVSRVVMTGASAQVHLKGYGLIQLFRVVTPDGDTEHWATHDRTMTRLTRRAWAERAWTIENYHRGIKQFCGIERCQARGAKAQRNHIGLAVRAFRRLEWHSLRTGLSWFELKMQIIRQAVRAYLTQPMYTLAATA